ncbi:MAG TPA: HemK/PrmC family methyltransferase [Candidatus Saccharimonadia bacterium]|nr:HemK/PrmC family methyltransferase [Candidatus Saccharimonadia bacterium]
MKIADWLREATGLLEGSGIGTARLDALVLLEGVSGKDRAWLLAHPDSKLSPEQGVELKKLLKRRSAHEPLAYVRGKSEFYGREFIVNNNVLEPRPESETMIDLLKRLPDLPSPLYLSDIGCGSGALGITAALEFPKAHVELLEIDAKALKVARINVDKFTLRIPALKSNLLSGSKYNSGVLLCNLPYVPDTYSINTSAGHEPKIAIFGGPDGLDLYRKLFEQAKDRLQKSLYILTESLPFQHNDLTTIAESAGYELSEAEDFIQVFRHPKI